MAWAAQCAGGVPDFLGLWITVLIDGQPWQASCYVKATYWRTTPVEEKFSAANCAAEEVPTLGHECCPGLWAWVSRHGHKRSGQAMAESLVRDGRVRTARNGRGCVLDTRGR